MKDRYPRHALSPATRLFSSAALASALWACGGGAAATDGDMGTCKDGVLSGIITRDCTLTADRRWTLMGQVTVASGATLSIEPGTTVMGEYDPMRVSFLVVDRGGKIRAVGTKDRPIVFTSARAVGQRAPGDWGGVVLKGRASINVPGGEADLEGEAGRYGGGESPDDNDSSGELRYVRIEFAGKVYAKDVELNGLTLGAVGRGTRIEYVQVVQALDDGFEMFGGTVDLKHCVASWVQDDGFDWDYGYRGRGQFLVVQQNLVDGNNGIEGDNNEKNNDLAPVSHPVLYNVTLVGTGRGSEALKQKRFGLTLRRGTAGQLHNLIVMGFDGMLGGAGLVIDQESTVKRARTGDLDITHSVFFANGKEDRRNVSDLKTIGASMVPFDVEAWVLGGDKMNRVLDPMLRSPHDTAAPLLQPQPGSPVLSGARQPHLDGFFEAADYVGAVGPAEDWLAGWTAYPVR